MLDFSRTPHADLDPETCRTLTGAYRRLEERREQLIAEWASAMRHHNRDEARTIWREVLDHDEAMARGRARLLAHGITYHLHTGGPR